MALIYIYIYILSSTDRLFRSIRTLQCGKTHRTLEAGIETRPTLAVQKEMLLPAKPSSDESSCFRHDFRAKEPLPRKP